MYKSGFDPAYPEFEYPKDTIHEPSIFRIHYVNEEEIAIECLDVTSIGTTSYGFLKRDVPTDGGRPYQHVILAIPPAGTKIVDFVGVFKWKLHKFTGTYSEAADTDFNLWSIPTTHHISPNNFKFSLDTIFYHFDPTEITNFNISTSTLNVNGYNGNIYRNYFLNDTSAGASVSINTAVGLEVVYNIRTNGVYLVSSDSRIKTNIIDVPDNLALQQLRSIPCRYYEYVDKISRGTDNTIGFIAQEVNSVLPMAVSLQEDFIPDVYKIIECNWTTTDNTIKMSSNDLSNVDSIEYKFYVSNNDIDIKEIKITGNSDNTFTFEEKYNKVFCFGKKVNDFHTLDKAKLFALNFSATQEIDRIQQEHITKISSLETENTLLKTQVNDLTNIINTLKNANSFEEFKNSL